MDKEKFKNIIKNVNSEGNDRNNFYQDEIKRVRDDKNVNVNKLKVEIELLTKQLQEEKEKNKSLEDKIKELKDKFVVIEKEKTTIIEKYETKIV